MKTKQHVLRITLLLASVVALFGASALDHSPAAWAAPAGSQPAGPAAAGPQATLPATTCSLAGSTRTCEVWARAGTLTLPDSTVVSIWGFADGAAQPAALPGPQLIVNQGERVEVTLHNDLAGETVSLSFPGQDLVPDMTGIVSGASATYVFTPTLPGTFSYEAGLTPNGGRQVAMGLFGALIVRPAADPLWAYDADSAFDDEALVVINGIDPDFNNDPAGFALQDYKPSYWLVNGQSYPDADPIDTAPGNRVLLRYLNGGVENYYMALLGVHQTFIGIDGNRIPITNTYSLVSQAIASGQTMDAIVTIPSQVSVGTRFPLFNPSLQLHNAGALAANNRVGFGGLLTFLQIAGGNPVPDVGPLASNVTVAPSPTAGNNGATLSADLDETDTGGANIVEWEYFINDLGAPGTGYTATITSPAVTLNVTATVTSATLAALPAGDVIFYVHGRDASGNWGPVGSAVLDLVIDGPVIRGMVLTSSPANGTLDVRVRATADERPTADNLDVVGAEYFIDTPGAPGMGTVMLLNITGPVVEASANIPAAVVDGLSEGTHTVYIRASDELGNWGGLGTIDLVVDKTGPSAAGLSLLPNPNNGTLPLNTSIYAVRLRAIVGDQSIVQRAEGFIDYAGSAEDPDGSGFPLVAADALYNSTVEEVYFDIPLSTIRLLAAGPHTIDFHGKDTAGNWGPLGSMTLVVDKTGPATSGALTLPNPTLGATTVLLIASSTDPLNGGASGSNLVAAEWFVGFDPGPGFGTAMTAADGSFNSASEAIRATVDVSGWPNGNHVISVRARDAAGNWGPVTTTSLTVSGNTPAAIFNNGFETGDLTGWGQAVGAVAVTDAAALEGGFGLQATLSQNPAYVVDQRPMAEASYRASFLFHPNGADTAGEQHDLFVGRSVDGTVLFGIAFERSVDGPEVRAWVRQGGVEASTGWNHVADAPNHLEIVWEAGADATFAFLLDGVEVETLTGLDTSAYRLEEVWLGPSGNLSAGMSGVEFFDSFQSVRSITYSVFLPMVMR